MSELLSLFVVGSLLSADLLINYFNSCFPLSFLLIFLAYRIIVRIRIIIGRVIAVSVLPLNILVVHQQRLPFQESQAPLWCLPFELDLLEFLFLLLLIIVLYAIDIVHDDIRIIELFGEMPQIIQPLCFETERFGGWLASSAAFPGTAYVFNRGHLVDTDDLRGFKFSSKMCEEVQEVRE